MEINPYSGTVVDCKYAKDGPWCKFAEVVHGGGGGYRRCPEFTGDKCEHRKSEQEARIGLIAV